MPKDSKHRRGRPAGTPNATYLDAISIPPQCPSCKSIELVAKPGSKAIEKNIAGKLQNGFAYIKIRWQRSTCKNCGQAVNVRTFFPAN